MIDKIENFCLKILEKIKLKKLADWYRKHQEAMRYLIFGALTTLVNILVYIVFAKVILVNVEIEELKVNISEVVAFIAGVAFAYITNKLYVFKSKTENKMQLFREIASFTGCRIFTELISLLMMNMAIWFSINDVFMKILANVVVIVLNYVFSKILIFRKKKKSV